MARADSGSCGACFKMIVLPAIRFGAGLTTLYSLTLASLRLCCHDYFPSLDRPLALFLVQLLTIIPRQRAGDSGKRGWGGSLTAPAPDGWVVEFAVVAD